MKNIGIVILGLVLSSCGDEAVKKTTHRECKETDVRGVIVAPIGVPCPLPIETDKGTIIVMPPPIDIFDD